MSLDELFGQLVVDPIFHKLTRPSDVLEILDEEAISGLCVRIEPPPEESRRQCVVSAVS